MASWGAGSSPLSTSPQRQQQPPLPPLPPQRPLRMPQTPLTARPPLQVALSLQALRSWQRQRCLTPMVASTAAPRQWWPASWLSLRRRQGQRLRRRKLRRGTRPGRNAWEEQATAVLQIVHGARYIIRFSIPQVYLFWKWKVYHVFKPNSFK